MSENTQLATSNDANAMSAIQQVIAGAQPLASNETFEALAKASDYLARLQMCGSSSKLFKKDKIKTKGNYAYIVTDENFIDLGRTVDVLPICWRPKALDMRGDTPVSFYDEKSEAFKEVQAMSLEKDSNCTYGPEFLVWIPSIKKFAGLHFGSKTARMESPKMLELQKKGTACTLDHAVISKKDYTWEGMIVNPCSTPIELPAVEALSAQISKFNEEAKATGPVKAEATKGRDR